MARRRNSSDEFGRADDFQPAINAFLRLPPRVQLLLVTVLVVAGLIAAVVYFVNRRRVDSTAQTQTNNSPQTGPTRRTPPSQTPQSPTAPADASVQLFLGNPSGATADPANRNNFLMLKPYYALSYNDANGTPNWVSWRVTSADLGSAPRKQMFDADNSLPADFKVVNHQDYTGSGFDRGHMCPHSDRAGNIDMSYATFMMTNIIPQAPNVNQKAWAQLEIYSREMVTHGSRLYTICGPFGQGGVGSKGAKSTVGRGKVVVVPDSCWKIVVAVPDHGVDDLAEITASTRVIAVDMPNNHDVVGDPWAGFRVSPAQIEAKTGLHFFDRLPPEIANALRQKVDDVPVAPPKPLTHER